MRKACLAVAFLTVGCGPDFTGTYTGSLADSGFCSDGSSENVTVTVNWNVTEQGSAIHLSTNGSCGQLDGTITGAGAVLNGKTCTPVVSSTSTVTRSITSASLTLQGKSLAVSGSAMDTVQLSNGVSGTCSPGITGTLTKN